VYQPPNLTGRNALVLGANDPVAAAIALAFAKAGAGVAVTSTSGDPEEAFALRPLRRAIEAEGRRAIADIADLGNGSSVQIAVRQVAKQLGRIDIGVIVSSEALDKPSERVTDAEWSRALGFNLGAYFYAARALAREFAANEPVDGIKGRIIALLPALDPQTASPTQLAAHAGAEALIEALAREWHSAGIRLTSITVDPEMHEAGAVAAALAFAADH
jgi:NAD(P)-dependent dehydrogenase (short-subunit alcohol dehydrogenase family)